MNDLNKHMSYWDGVAKEKMFTHPIQWDAFDTLLSCDGKILDYGCGYGRTCTELVENGYENVTGVDFSSEMIKRGLQSHPDLNLQHIDSCRIPFPDNSFDACLLLAVLTCIPEDFTQKTLINELYRVLRPGGFLYLSDYPLQQDDKNDARYKQFKDEFGKMGIFKLSDGGIVRHHDMEWIYDLLASFEIQKENLVKVITMNGGTAQIFQIIAQKGV